MKERIGAMAVVVGIIGCGFAVGGVDNAESLKDWITVAGVTITSIMCAQLGVWMIKDEV